MVPEVAPAEHSVHVTICENTLPLLHGRGCSWGSVAGQAVVDQRARFVCGVRGHLELDRNAIGPQLFRFGWLGLRG